MMIMMRLRKPVGLTNNAIKRSFGNFELFHPIPPRYFLVKYEID